MRPDTYDTESGYFSAIEIDSYDAAMLSKALVWVLADALQNDPGRMARIVDQQMVQRLRTIGDSELPRTYLATGDLAREISYAVHFPMPFLKSKERDAHDAARHVLSQSEAEARHLFGVNKKGYKPTRHTFVYYTGAMEDQAV